MEAKKAFEAGEILFVEGEPGDQIYIIESGEVLLLKEESGRCSALARVSSGGFVGELCAFSDRAVRNLSAVAIEDTITYCVKANDTHKVLDVCPGWVSEIMEILSSRLKASTEIMKEHRICAEDVEKFSEKFPEKILSYQDKIESYRLENGLK